MKFSTQFKKSFSYTWYLYLIAIVVPAVLFPLSYSFMHRAKQYEVLSLFVPVSLKREDAEDILFEEFKDLGIRNAEIINVESNDNTVEFVKKLSVVAYNRCDIMIIPEVELDKVGIETASLELTSEVKQLCSISDENIYTYEGTDYGVKIPSNTPINEFADLKNDANYYAFINSKSWNIGEYSSQKLKTENAFKMMQYILGK